MKSRCKNVNNVNALHWFIVPEKNKTVINCTVKTVSSVVKYSNCGIAIKLVGLTKTLYLNYSYSNPNCKNSNIYYEFIVTNTKYYSFL